MATQARPLRAMRAALEHPRATKLWGSMGGISVRGRITEQAESNPCWFLAIVAIFSARGLATKTQPAACSSLSHFLVLSLSLSLPLFLCPSPQEEPRRMQNGAQRLGELSNAAELGCSPPTTQQRHKSLRIHARSLLTHHTLKVDDRRPHLTTK